MTITNTSRTVAYTGNGVTVAFAVPFIFWGSNEIEVIERVIATGGETVKVETTHYTVSGGAGATGTVTAVTAPASTVEWHIRGKTSRTQQIDYVQNDNFDAETHEEGLDRAVALIQELEQDLDRTPKFPKTDPASSIGDFPNSVDRASQLLGFDANGAPIASGGTGGITISAAMTAVVQAASLTAARQALGALGNERLAKTANYTVANGDKFKTIACGTAPWTLTFSAISGGNYDADFAVFAVNESTTRAIYVSLASGYGAFWLFPGQGALVYNQNSLWRAIRPECWKIPGTTTFYVDPTNGNDNNDGLASGSGNALATVAAAVSRVCQNLDFNTATVTIQHANGTYTTGVTLGQTSNWIGGGVLQFKGDTTTPSNVTYSVTGGSCFTIAGVKSGQVQLTGFKLSTTTAGFGVIVTQRGYVNLNAGMEFGATAYGQIGAAFGGLVEINSNYTISGGSMIHWEPDDGGTIICTGKTITLTGTPAFSVAFARSMATSFIYCPGCTFSGSATGTRYSAVENGVIRTNGGGATYLPGNAAGSTATGGQYN